jgi:hypothetical protein
MVAIQHSQPYGVGAMDFNKRGWEETIIIKKKQDYRI